MARSDEYWDKRALKRLTDAEKQSEKYIARIEKMYDQAERNIQREIEAVYNSYSNVTGMDVQSLKALLTMTETEKFWDSLKREGLDKYVKQNYKARITRLERIKAEIYAKAKQVYPQEQKAHTEHYNSVVRGGYYKTIYDTQVGTGADFAFSKIDDNMVKKLLDEKWSGKNYSQRIWGNTDLLAQSLSEIVGGALLSGQSIAKTSRQIRERFDVSKYYADRLVRTETNHFNNEADAMAYEEMGLDKYVFRATLDTRTSTICQDLDGEVFDTKDRQIGVNFPPMHPLCRSKTRAYMGEEIEATMKRRARNPATGKNEIVGNISYKEWAKQNGLEIESAEKDVEGLTKKENTGIIQNKPTIRQSLAIAKERKRAGKYAEDVSFVGATNPKNLKTVNDTLGKLTAKYPTKKLEKISLADFSNEKPRPNARASHKTLTIDRGYINKNVVAKDWAGRVESNKAEIKKLRKSWLTKSRAERQEIENTISLMEKENMYNRWSVSSSGYGVSGTITHEYGHILSEQRIGLRKGSEAIVQYNASNEAKYQRLRAKVLDAFEKAKENGDIFNISMYAESNEREFFAEVFAMREYGEPLPDYIGEMLTEVINVS